MGVMAGLGLSIHGVHVIQGQHITTEPLLNYMYVGDVSGNRITGTGIDINLINMDLGPQLLLWRLQFLFYF